MSYIGVLDCNNFFVSCERLFRPDLKDKPTLVLSSNDGCVVARSQEVKDLGIPMGIPHFKVKDLIKKHNIAIFSSNFTLYRDISSRVMLVLCEEVGNVEQYSIDESFFMIDGDEAGLAPRLQEIRGVIETKVGIPVSLGLAKTKTIAKYASNKEKRGSRACVLLGETWQKLTPTIPVQEIWGIGRETTAKLNKLGLMTVYDLLETDSARIDKLFGINGLRLKSELSEISVHRMFESVGMKKSIMSSRSFSKEINDIKELKTAVSYHIENACEDLREQKAVAKELRVMLLPGRCSDWSLRGGVLLRELPYSTSDTRVILAEAYKLVDQLFESGVPYKKAGVILSAIQSKELRQDSLFVANNTADNDLLMEVVDRINNRYGKNNLMFGRVNKYNDWKVSTAYLSPNYTTKWGDLRSAKA